jgi:hypothetical protein
MGYLDRGIGTTRARPAPRKGETLYSISSAERAPHCGGTGKGSTNACGKAVPEVRADTDAPPPHLRKAL